jgi:SAM-dependent methyltransferase
MGGPLLRGALQLLERFAFGGRLRERILLRVLRAHYRSLYRREWVWAEEPPHFYDHRLGVFELLAGTANPLAYTRGFLAAEVVRPGDRVLDIGCGDGFLTSRFLAPRAASVDAVDVEPSAIEHARRLHTRSNVRYALTDAVSEPFPGERYDVIAWDGALGHFAPETTAVMFAKIRDALGPDGVFVGSESLGHEGHDHLQFFETLDDLRGALSEHFGHVLVREAEYELGNGTLRREAYWRCAESPERLERASWRSAGRALSP